VGAVAADGASVMLLHRGGREIEIAGTTDSPAARAGQLQLETGSRRSQVPVALLVERGEGRCDTVMRTSYSVDPPVEVTERIVPDGLRNRTGRNLDPRNGPIGGTLNAEGQLAKLGPSIAQALRRELA